MKKLILLLLAVILYNSNLNAQKSTLLGKMVENERNEYLSKIAKEVTQNFGPGWYRKSVIPSISEMKVFDKTLVPDTQAELSKNVGRGYYVVTLNYDEKTRKKYIWSYASKVSVWADDGEPFMITFGNSMGINFMVRTYHQWVRAGIEKEEKNFFDALTWEEFQKQLQPMYETIKHSHENTK